MATPRTADDGTQYWNDADMGKIGEAVDSLIDEIAYLRGCSPDGEFAVLKQRVNALAKRVSELECRLSKANSEPGSAM
jgi:hypothetical protein